MPFSCRNLTLFLSLLALWGQGGSVVAQRPAQDVKGTYAERHRPQFHFSPTKNWMNDPNGLVYHQGKYHLFFQHNPEGREWGNMTWGHATSTDLVHWTQHVPKIWPDSLGTIYSGSAVVDPKNTSGFQTGDETPIVAAFTYAGEHAVPEKPYTQGLAYSTDGGRTFQKYEGNPVLPNVSGGRDRDPQVLWHEPTQQWVMVLYLDKGRRFGFFTSPDLKDWTKVDEVRGLYEVPDFFKLPVEGNPEREKWVLVDVFGNYLIGSFDGTDFTVESGRHRGDYGNNFYAPQTWNNTPNGRRIQIAWMRGGDYPGMPFNQQMSFPCRLTMRSTSEGLRLYRHPIRHRKELRTEVRTLTDTVLAPGTNPLVGLTGDLFEIYLKVKMEDASVIGLGVGGTTYPNYDARVEYFASDHTVSFTPRASSNVLGATAPLHPQEGTIELRLLVDRTSVEVFGNGGRISMTNHYLRSGDTPAATSLDLYAQEGDALLKSLKVYRLASIWDTTGNHK